MNTKFLFAVAALSASGLASAQLPSATLSAVGKNVPGLGTFGIENLVLGGPDFFVPPNVLQPDGMAGGAPALSLSLVGEGLPGLPDLGFKDLVLGGPQGFEFPFLVGSTDLALTGGELFDQFAESFPGGLPGLEGGIPGFDLLPGVDQLPVGPEALLQFADPSAVGDVLTFLADPANAPPPMLPMP